uniref:Uncharacterized protein n=1 Tax=uncultured marine microorganism HF4000_APKG7H23 TaxID=455551 RepID=B3T9V0_9ZZZZ|nr:hypothetical protein ALOHA_HF4000APKG7H23ctg3g24 [uncultured marine microorganism HF4000_APKG7H23]
MRTPPRAGPNVVSWMAMKALRPTAGSVQMASSSWPYASMCSAIFMGCSFRWRGLVRQWPHLYMMLLMGAGWGNHVCPLPSGGADSIPWCSGSLRTAAAVRATHGHGPFLYSQPLLRVPGCRPAGRRWPRRRCGQCCIRLTRPRWPWHLRPRPCPHCPR